MEGNGGPAIKRKDTTKGPPLRILSLDGGGVRGYSMLIIIQELMHRTYVEIEGKAPRRDQIPKPADHFDLICGTGTGGLIAIMLGRLRLDLETCKEVYVRMTRKVFETDKTIAGIPYRSTLFKASKLEEAIKECVKEHTIFEGEGNDANASDGLSPIPMSPVPMSPFSPQSRENPRRHASNASVASFSNRSPASYQSRPYVSARWGNPNAKLYDNREFRTKTAVTAIYKGTPKGGSPALLRSYDSRKEPSPEYDCKIWEAGRATSATGLAFKPIQVGQSVFIDEGAGQYNPSPTVLDEAAVNEWPGREIGVFVSIGTGKRPAGSDQNSHLWYEGFMGEFAEARRRLISKIEGCEATHQYMMEEGLAKRGVNIENYYRLNVEIGVGEFGMNEWNRLADISTGTRRYLGKSDIQRMNVDAAAKLAKIHRAKLRWEHNQKASISSNSDVHKDLPDVPEADPMAIELPAEIPSTTLFAAQRADPYSPQSRTSYESGHDTLEIPRNRNSNSHLHSPRSSNENQYHFQSPHSSPLSKPSVDAHDSQDEDKFTVNSPTPSQYMNASGADKIAIMSLDEWPRPLDYQSRSAIPRMGPPPVPPKTPIQDPNSPLPRRKLSTSTPYPLEDGPPPVVNMSRKPNYGR